jgi:predicted nucleotidyltransferase
MSEGKLELETLPAGIRQRLQEWTKALEKSLGDELVGIIVHGSSVRGEYRPGESDVDVVVVVKDASFEKLESISNAMQLARYSARIEAMILTEKEIGGASDCFPLLYDEIRRRHVLLVGRDPFKDVEVHDTHRRLRIEQELREAQIRLRRAVTDSAGAREAIAGAVTRKVKQIRTPLHALLALKGVTCDPDLPSVLEQAAETWKIELAPLRAARERPDAAHATLVSLLDKTIEDVNAMER